MRAGRLLVGIGRMLGPVSVSVLKQPEKIFRAGRLVPGQSGNVDAGVSVLSDVQHGVRVDQVDDVLVVDLQIGDGDLAAGVLFQLKRTKPGNADKTGALPVLKVTQVQMKTLLLPHFHPGMRKNDTALTP